MSNSQSTPLASMQHVTVTGGWDVLVAYNAAGINDLFAAQVVTNVGSQQNVPPINDTMTVAGLGTVQFVNLTPNGSQQFTADIPGCIWSMSPPSAACRRRASTPPPPA